MVKSRRGGKKPGGCQKGTRCQRAWSLVYSSSPQAAEHAQSGTRPSRPKARAPGGMAGGGAESERRLLHSWLRFRLHSAVIYPPDIIYTVFVDTPHGNPGQNKRVPHMCRLHTKQVCSTKNRRGETAPAPRSYQRHSQNRVFAHGLCHWQRH